MNIHEYQAKSIMAGAGLRTPGGEVAHSVEEAVAVAKKLGGEVWVVKAQIHAGGRGKAGGVKLARSLQDVERCAEEVLGKVLVTHQTGPEGKTVHALLIEKGVDIESEYYVGLVLDRESGRIIFMASSEGGVEIEKVAAETPQKIIKVVVEPAVGFTPFIGRKLAYGMGMRDKVLVGKAIHFFQGLYRLYVEKDCTQVEVNPLILSRDGEITALDAKFNFDDNALFRHSEIAGLRDPNEESEKEWEAHEFGLSYISLEGNIGCLVNGAGLAMATMDIIKLEGGSPANFLDVGGSASKEAVEKAFSIILSDTQVKAILVNIFGGIMKCDIIAEGIVAAAQSLEISVPLIVRLEGTNVTLGEKILSDSGLNIVSVKGLGEAAKKVVEAVQVESEEV